MTNQRQTRLGMRRIHELFTDFKLCRQIIAKNGSATEHPPGYKFIGGLHCPDNRGGSVCYIDKKTYFLYGKPTDLTVQASDPNMMEGRVDSFKISLWDDKALVIGMDRTMIGTAWIAFIPLEDVPDTKNIEIYTCTR